MNFFCIKISHVKGFQLFCVEFKKRLPYTRNHKIFSLYLSGLLIYTKNKLTFNDQKFIYMTQIVINLPFWCIYERLVSKVKSITFERHLRKNFFQKKHDLMN